MDESSTVFRRSDLPFLRSWSLEVALELCRVALKENTLYSNDGPVNQRYIAGARIYFYRGSLAREYTKRGGLKLLTRKIAALIANLDNTNTN